MSKIIGNFTKFLGVDKVRKKLQTVFEDDLNTHVKRRYEEITAPFESAFEFEVVDESAGADNFRFSVRPVNVEIARSDTVPERGTVSSWVLFNTLDLGSHNAAQVFLPDNFSNETAPNSLSTSSKAYDRDKIFVNSANRGEGMAPRNWSILLADEYEARRFVKPRAVIKKVVSQALGRE